MDKIFTDFGPNINNPVMLRAMMLPRHGVFEQRIGYNSSRILVTLNCVAQLREWSN